MAGEWRVLLTGSRDWSDERTIRDRLALQRRWHDDAILVHGACPTGADAIARRIWVDEWGMRDEPHPAAWERLGRAAGPVRNREMIQLGADVCLAFIRDYSTGSSQTAHWARLAKIPVLIARSPAAPP